MQQRRRYRRHTGRAQGMSQSACLVHGRAQLVLCNQQQNTIFISSHACSKGLSTRDTQLLHKARTKARALSMPMHSRHYIINNKTLYLLAVTHAAKASAHETHSCYTRHVPRCMPHPCPCTTNVIKSKTNFISIDACSKGHGKRDTQLLHKAFTKARASSMPVHH